tara:strand:+ start:13 stop:180 length:168 start_codon:yes stop_codon:yes gene_type:complete
MSRKIYGYLILSALFVMFFLASVFIIGVLDALISISIGITLAVIIIYAASLISQQ